MGPVPVGLVLCPCNKAPVRHFCSLLICCPMFFGWVFFSNAVKPWWVRFVSRWSLSWQVAMSNFVGFFKKNSRLTDELVFTSINIVCTCVRVCVGRWWRWWWGGRRTILKMFAGETKFVSVVTGVTVFRETVGNSWLTNLTTQKIQTSLQTWHGY